MNMAPNPFLNRLGFSNTDRLVIIHTDDIGMCHASVQAFEELWERGTISSGAVMVPCPWFPAVAQLCRAHPDIDMGVHATLNAEWDAYRWAPLSTRDPGSGLLDAEGYFHQWHPAVYANAKPEAVAVEVTIQIERALAAGIDVTHVDSHMGTIMNPLFIRSYIRAAADRRLPNMLPRLDAHSMGMMGANQDDLKAYETIMDELHDQGLLMLDGLVSMPLDEPDGQLETAQRLLGDLPAGITHFILHPSVNTPELRAICPDWESRVANYEAFMSDEMGRFIEREEFRLIGYRQIRDAIGQG